MRLIAPLLAALLACTATAAFAQWQWIDKDGRKVFSDRAPPPDILDKNILQRPAVRAQSATPAPNAAPGESSDANAQSAAAAAPKVSAVDKELEAKKKQAADLELAKRRAEEERVAKANIENCARAKQAKVTLNSGLRLSQVNKDGQPEVMDDAARAAELKRVQTTIDAVCK